MAARPAPPSSQIRAARGRAAKDAIATMPVRFLRPCRSANLCRRGGVEHGMADRAPRAGRQGRDDLYFDRQAMQALLAAEASWGGTLAERMEQRLDAARTASALAEASDGTDPA